MDSLIVFCISFLQSIVFFLILLVLFAILSKLAHTISFRATCATRGLWRNSRGNHSRAEH